MGGLMKAPPTTQPGEPTMAKRIKVYELTKAPHGLSTQSINYSYSGKIVAVAAVSIKQAYYFAYNDVWVDEEDLDRPLGILWTFSKGHPKGDTLPFDGNAVGGRGRDTAKGSGRLGNG